MPDTNEQDAVKEARELLAKATPGPWKVYADSRPDIVTEAKVNSGYMGERHLLSMDKYGKSWGQKYNNEDDAELIARAPELLKTLCDEFDQRTKALRMMVELWDAEHPDDPCGCVGASDDCRHPPTCELCVARLTLEGRINEE